MAKNDILDSIQDNIQIEETSYKSELTNDLFKKIAQNINNLCDCLSSLKCEVLPFGTTSWTAPAGFINGVAIGISGAGGGGGTAPADSLGGTDNVTFYAGTSGGIGGATRIGGQTVAFGGRSGTRFTFVRVNDNGATSSEASYVPINPRCSNIRDFFKGLRVPIGGTGAHSSGDPLVLNGENFFRGGAEGGESGRVGFKSLDFMTAGTTYTVEIGAGGSDGSNHSFTNTWAANRGFSITNATAGQNSPGMVLIYMEK